MGTVFSYSISVTAGAILLRRSVMGEYKDICLGAGPRTYHIDSSYDGSILVRKR